MYALYNFIFKSTFVALDHTIAHHISAAKRCTEGPCGDANLGSGRGLSRGQDRRVRWVRSAGIGGNPMNHGYLICKYGLIGIISHVYDGYMVNII